MLAVADNSVNSKWGIYSKLRIIDISITLNGCICIVTLSKNVGIYPQWSYRQAK